VLTENPSMGRHSPTSAKGRQPLAIRGPFRVHFAVSRSRAPAQSQTPPRSRRCAPLCAGLEGQHVVGVPPAQPSAFADLPGLERAPIRSGALEPLGRVVGTSHDNRASARLELGLQRAGAAPPAMGSETRSRR
jgi:hypothetical protein